MWIWNKILVPSIRAFRCSTDAVFPNNSWIRRHRPGVFKMNVSAMSFIRWFIFSTCRCSGVIGYCHLLSIKQQNMFSPSRKRIKIGPSFYRRQCRTVSWVSNSAEISSLLRFDSSRSTSEKSISSNFFGFETRFFHSLQIFNVRRKVFEQRRNDFGRNSKRFKMFLGDPRHKNSPN